MGFWDWSGSAQPRRKQRSNSERPRPTPRRDSGGSHQKHRRRRRSSSDPKSSWDATGDRGGNNPYVGEGGYDEDSAEHEYAYSNNNHNDRYGSHGRNDDNYDEYNRDRYARDVPSYGHTNRPYSPPPAHPNEFYARTDSHFDNGDIKKMTDMELGRRITTYIGSVKACTEARYRDALRNSVGHDWMSQTQAILDEMSYQIGAMKLKTEKRQARQERHELVKICEIIRQTLADFLSETKYAYTVDNIHEVFESQESRLLELSLEARSAQSISNNRTWRKLMVPTLAETFDELSRDLVRLVGMRSYLTTRMSEYRQEYNMACELSEAMVEASLRLKPARR